MIQTRWGILLAAFVACASSFIVGSQHVDAASCPVAFDATASTPPAGRCETYQNQLTTDGSLGFCNGIVDYQYFLPTGQNQTFLETTAQSKLLGTNPQAALLLLILPNACTTQLKRIVCLVVFQACEFVDPYYLDTNCVLTGHTCKPCGDITTPLPPAVKTGNPTYGSACYTTPAGDTTIGNTNNCVVGPGKVPGLGNIGWELAKTLNPAYNAFGMEKFCSDQGLHWIASAKACKAAVPRSPCKGECNKALSMDRSIALTAENIPYFSQSVCPIVSGNYSLSLSQIIAGSTDPYLIAQANASLNGATGGRTSIGLLTAFTLAPNCMETVVTPSGTVYAFGETQILETFPSRASPASVMAAKAAAGASKCHCITNYKTALGTPEETNEYCDTALTATYCSALQNTISKCNSAGGSRGPNSAVRFVGKDDFGMNPICRKVVSHPTNQPSNASLALLQAGFGVTAEQARGAFFVPPTPGLPALAGGNMTRPLCQLPNALRNGYVYTGYNSYECILATVNAASGVIPPILSGNCRRSFLDLLCNQAHMKLDVKTLCLLPSGLGTCLTSPLDIVAAASTNRLAFTFALPRFPGRSLCQSFKSECDGFLTSLGDRRAGIEAAFNCTGVIDQTCSKNTPLDPWTSSLWGCSSSFNNLPSYPLLAQGLANVNALLGAYGVANGIDASLLGASSVASASISDANLGGDFVNTCECPFPLVVPDSNTAPTLSNGTCCQQRCGFHAWTTEEFNSIIGIQRVVSIIGLIGTSFILMTWGVFKVKRSQPLTFFFAVASFNVCLTFIIPTYYKPEVREVWCKDNTQANTQADGGMCLFQSIWLPFWTIAACSFWLVQAFDLYMRIVRNKRHLEHFTKWYHLFGWGLPSLIVIIFLSTQSLGYDQGQLWCFFGSLEGREALRLGLDLGLFYGTIITIWATGLSLMIAVLYQIYKITSKTASTAQSGNMSKRMIMYRTPVFFVFFFVYVWVSIFGWRFDSEINKPALRLGTIDWAACLLSNFAAGIPNPAFSALANTTLLQLNWGLSNGTGCGESIPNGPSFGSIVYLMIITGAQGIFIFFIFGAKVENLLLWKEKLGLTTKKYDTTAEDSSTKEKSGAKPSILSNAMSSLFAPSSPKANDSTEREGGSAIMVNGLQSGKFMAVTDVNISSPPPPVKSNQVAAAYMSDGA